MRKAIVLLAALSLAVAANAEVRLFFTASTADGYIPGTMDPAPGLMNRDLWDNPSQAITSDDQVPDYTNNLDGNHYGIENWPVYDGSTPTIDPLGADGIAGTGDDEFVYMWIQFYDENDNIKLFSATLDVAGPAGDDVNPVYYKFDNRGNNNLKRWDGASTEADNYATFRQDPQNLTAVTAYGVVNKPSTAQHFPAGPDLWGHIFSNPDTWNGFNADGTADFYTTPNPTEPPPLQGDAARIGLFSSYQPMVEGTYTINIPLEDPDDANTPLFVIDGVGPVMPTIGSFVVIPEPASLLLVGLAGLLIRRR